MDRSCSYTVNTKAGVLPTTKRTYIIKQMDAAQRIIEEFNRLVALGHAEVLTRPFPEQVVYFVVVARCEAEMDGFASIYEQALNADEMHVLIDGLHMLGEESLAAEFARGFEVLKGDGFYGHRNWKNVCDQVKQQIDMVGERVGSKLWGLDEKLAALLDGNSAVRNRYRLRGYADACAVEKIFASQLVDIAYIDTIAATEMVVIPDAAVPLSDAKDDFLWLKSIVEQTLIEGGEASAVLEAI